VRVPDAVKVTEFEFIENETPEPAKNVLYVKPDPPEFDDRKALLAFIAVSPVPPLAIPVTFNDLHALPSYFQVFPLSEKIWFVVGDVGKFSAINVSIKGIYLFILHQSYKIFLIIHIYV
jgi:hypothetical protein